MSAAMREAPQSRLDAARAAHAAIHARLGEIALESAKVEGNAQSVAPGGSSQSIRQARSGVLARMLRVGRVEQTPEVRALDRQLLSAEEAERREAAIAEARNAVLAELHAEARSLTSDLPAARRELAQAEFEAATADLEQVMIPAYFAAASRLKDSYASLAGAGRAHCQMARVLREEHGVVASALGQDNPLCSIAVSPVPPGFGISNTGGFNTLRFGVGAAVGDAFSDALRRWRSA